MQALSVLLPLSGISRTRRKRVYCLSAIEVSNGFHCWNPMCGFSSKVKLYLICQPKRGNSFGSCSIPLALALEKEAIGSDKDSADEVILSDGIDVVKEIPFDGSNEPTDNKEYVGKEKEDNSELGEEKSKKVDVRALGLSLEFAKTADEVEVVLKDFADLPLNVYSSMLRGLGVDKKVDTVMAVYEWLKRKKIETDGTIYPNLYIYNSLLGALKQSHEFGLMEMVVKDMEDEGVIPNIVTYNILMAIHLEKGRSKEALNVLQVMQNTGLRPTPVTYSTALLAYRRMEDGNGALKFFVEVKERYQNGEIGKDTDDNWDSEIIKLENFIVRICYQVMRRWLVKGVHLTKDVMDLLTSMDGAGLKPGRVDHEKLVWACTQEGHYIVARELYNRIREGGTGISLSVCNHVIWLLGKAKKWWAALEVYEDLLDKGPKPNNLSNELVISHFNILLTAARKRGIWRWGVRLLNKMEEKGLKVGSREWNAVLVACSKAAETSAAVQIFHRMVENGEKPTILSYGALLSALEKGKLYEEAIQVWDHMIKVGIQPNLYAYTIIASVYIGQGKSDTVESVMREMVKSGIEPTVVTFNAIISGCARNGMGSTAFDWFHRMKIWNIPPNEITYEMLIEALAIDAKPRLAYELYLRALSEELILSSKAYDAVLESATNYGATIDIANLGPRPPEKKKHVKNRKHLSEFCNLADLPRRSKPFEKEELQHPQLQGDQE